MDAEWITSPTARRIVVHWADSRPAWLWSGDGATLIWRNAAARLFNAKIKKSGLRLGEDPVPIRGQVARLVRLGSIGRSSLSRVQFLAGGKPIAATCSCTPLTLADGSAGLLLAGIDPIGPEIIEMAGGLGPDGASETILPLGAGYLLVQAGRVTGGTAQALSTHAPGIEARGLPTENAETAVLKAGPDDAMLVVYLPAADAPTIGEVRDEEGVSSDDAPSDADDLAHMPEPMLPIGLEALPAAAVPLQSTDDWVDPIPAAEPDRALSSLFDRLAEDSSLYSPLTAADEVFVPPEPVADQQVTPVDEGLIEAAPELVAEAETPRPEPVATAEPDMIAAVIDFADDPEDMVEPATEATPSHWLITGRGFRALEPPKDEIVRTVDVEPSSQPEAEAEAAPVASVDAAPDPETAERVSRYNFEELGRILSDRVAGEPPSRVVAEAVIAPRSAAAPESVINLNAETLVLNRLPLAILVFRDQQVLFANRALTDLLGYDSVQSLRQAGIAAIFPGEDGATAGPVNRLMRRDGTPMPVGARLQSVSWQGRAALMLSAAPSQPMGGHEAAVRAFAEIAAEEHEDGFLMADRAGTITQLSGHGSVLLGQPAQELIGKPLAILVGKADMEPLRLFLEKPARFAETTRPSLSATSEDGDTDLSLFAEGQAGVVTGYFGFLRRRVRIVAPPTADDEIEPGMLGRLSRGIRGPLNTIIGFADMIRSGAGTLERERTVEYARDIRTAGLEIAVLTDELDDFTRLRDGRYAPRPADVDLAALLESCMTRVRGQAGAARVLVRSAISERLPRVHADRPSLGQALLNLLASAIDQTPIGGSVILSAQTDDDGAIAIRVRDGAENGADLGERFVVFRDGVDKDGEQLGPVRSSVGLALTRSLLAVNACSLSVDPTPGTGTLFSLVIPAQLVVKN